ncbi:hypothetical protein RDWZM_008673 [Blomia tropicalis]|uniref:Nucleoprotein TPR n=1 Tax=Blomia tropicalis TaxID=40697 RepID=A0A9Q0M1R8_BLOTA|nr:hypothetical protein RDWZM_008673 [Blomia tropicalis]
MDVKIVNNKTSLIQSFRSKIDKFQSVSKELSNEIEEKNAKISSLNDENSQLNKDNDLLRYEVNNLSEENANHVAEIQQLRLLLQANDNGNNYDHNNLLKLSDELKSKTKELQRIKKESFTENIENLAQLNKNKNSLKVLKEKNELSQKFLFLKDEYIDLLSEYVQDLKSNSDRLEMSFLNEIRMQNKTIMINGSSNSGLQMQNKELKNELDYAKLEIEKLTTNLNSEKTNYDDLKDRHEKHLNDCKNEKESYVTEIDKLNDLVKRSKNEIVDHYIEKLYPHIKGLCQMLQNNMGISRLYSLYMDERKANDNLVMEKAILDERVGNLNMELEQLRIALDRYSDEVKLVPILEGKIFQLENDKKEQTIALRFYQDASQNIYKGCKTFNENLVKLSEKIQQLVQQTNEPSNENSGSENSGLLALEYITQLQSKFQEFNKLQTDYEKGKLELANQKKNLIETDNELNYLRERVSLCEIEKRIDVAKFNLVERELNNLQTLMNDTKTNYELDCKRLNDTNQSLQAKTDSFQEKIEKLKTKLKEVQDDNEKMAQEIRVLENKVLTQTQEVEFAEQRCSSQKNFRKQLEKSCVQLRIQNESLNDINRKLTENINQMQINIHTENDLSNQRLDWSKKHIELKEELNHLVNSLKQNSVSVEENVLNRLQLIENEKANLISMNEQKEKQWQEERTLLVARVAEFERLFSDESTKLASLNESYYKLQAIKAVVNDNAEVDGTIRSENDILRSQLQDLEYQFQELNNQLVTFKQKYIELTTENSNLVSSKNELELQLSAAKNDNSNTMIKLEQLKSELQSKVIELETKFNSTSEKYSTLIEQNRVEIENKESTCQSYLKQIEALNLAKIDLSSRLDQATFQGELTKMATFKSLIDSLYTENTILRTRIDSFNSKENRFNSEMEALKAKQAQEARLQKCLENMSQLKDTFAVAMNNDNEKIQSLFEVNRQLRLEKDELMRQCSIQKHEIDQFQQRMKSEDINLLHETLNEYRTQLEVLKTQINSKTLENAQLAQQLKAREDENQKLEKSVQELKQSNTNLNENLESLKRELENSNHKNRSEFNNVKSNLAAAEQVETNLRNDIEQLRKEVATLQNTNQQIKILARKYKSQCDELQKTVNSKTGTINESDLNQSSSVITEKDDKIKELEEKIHTSVTEYEQLKADNDRLNKENEQLRIQMNEKDAKAKKIAQQAWQKLSDNKRTIASKETEIEALKAQLRSSSISKLNQPTTSKFSSVSNRRKMPISSTYISASQYAPSTSFDALISSNLQPSSSNEDNVTLQSAQITSHSVDDNSSESMLSNIARQLQQQQQQRQSVPDSNVSSNKRGYSTDEGENSMKKTRRNDDNQVENLYEDEDDSNQSVDNIEEDSNDVSATAQSGSNYNQTSEESAEETIPLEDINVEDESNEQLVNNNQSDAASSSHQLVLSAQLDPLLTEPGPSNRNEFATSTGSTFVSHPLSLRSTSTVPGLEHHDDDDGRSIPMTSTTSDSLNTQPRLMILPPNNMHSSSNPIIGTIGPYQEDGEGIVPSTPILYVPRYEESMVSPQVQQPRFLFGNANSMVHQQDQSTAPSTSDSHHSISTIMVDDSVVDFDPTSPRASQMIDDQMGSSIPTSSDSSSNVPTIEVNQTDQQQVQSAEQVGRTRKLRILRRP